MWTKYSKYIVWTVVFCAGGFLAWYFFSLSPVLRQSCSKNYPFISKDIDCQTIDEVISQVEGLRGDISRIISDEKDQQHVMRVSVFYRDLNTRRWFGINDVDKFYPASLIKLPIATMYYKVAELEPSIFDKELQIPTDVGDNSDQHYPPADPLVLGKAYSIREMVRHMLVYSDNAPFSILYDYGKLFRDKILADLGVYAPPTGQESETWNVTARSYASIFRMLYNASYVNVQSSYEILDLLSQSTFKNGLVAGVPEGIKVAHKFGEAEGTLEDGTVHSRILNDCGIVYKSDAPYILCLMVEGQDYSQIEKVIERISHDVYTVAP